MNKNLYRVGIILYFAIGIVSMIAIWRGVQLFLNCSALVAAICSFFIANIPIIGSLAGVYGAHLYWGWGLIPSFLFFFAPTILNIISAIFCR